MERQRDMLNIGETLKGTYRLTRELGHSGFGKVFAGEDLLHNNWPVAIKVPFADNSTQFHIETIRLYQLQHPKIIPILDFDIDQGLPYLVMPLASKGSLQEEISLRKGQISIARSISAAEQIGEALAFLHERRIVHQDVKPANMLLQDSNNFWLSDLGVVKKLKPDDSLQPVPTPITAYYAAPEQSAGRAEPASDQYSLGITVYYLLTGTLPFQADNVVKMQVLHQNAIPRSLVEAVKDLNKDENDIHILKALDSVIMQAIAKEPYKRHASITLFTKTLNSALQQAVHEKPHRLLFEGAYVKKTPELPSSLPIHPISIDSQAPTIANGPGNLRAKQSNQTGLDYSTTLNVSDEGKIVIPDSQQGTVFADVESSKEQGRSWFEQGKKYLSEGKFEEALDAFSQAIQLDPTDFQMFHSKAEVLHTLRRYEGAVKECDLALQINPRKATIYITKAAALLALGRNQEALAASYQATQIDPLNTMAYVNKGRALFDLGKQDKALFAKALTAFEQAVWHDPLNYCAYVYKGIALSEFGRDQEALAAFNRALELDPKDETIPIVV